ncbi:MAG: ATP-dependent Clp protease proteolytic subunit [Bacteroidota bacterium]
MKKAKIYITGQIGNTYNDDGTVLVKGVELQDVVAQVEDAKKADATIEGYDVFINSLGGSIRVGKLIAKYVKSLPNCFTIADSECASMGTEIHLSQPIASRKIIAGTRYSIHNPLMANVSGNASELVELAEMIKENEKDMARMYVSATGLTKDAVTGLMNQETSLTPEQCVTMGFCSEILPSPKLNAVAFIDKPNNNSLMKTVKEMVDSAFAAFRKDMKIADVAVEIPAVAAEKTKEYTTDKGVVVITMKGEVGAIGDVVTVDGVPATEGVYTAEDGTVIEVDAAGLVVSIETKEEEVSEVATLKAEIESLKSANATMATEFEATLQTSMDELRGQIGSSFVPKEGQAKFANTKKVADKSVSELANEKKASYKKASR